MKLSKRDVDVATLIAKNYTNKEIAKELNLSEGTIKEYVSRLLRKTRLDSRTAIAIAYHTGKLNESKLKSE